MLARRRRRRLGSVQPRAEMCDVVAHVYPVPVVEVSLAQSGRGGKRLHQRVKCLTNDVIQGLHAKLHAGKVRSCIYVTSSEIGVGRHDCTSTSKIQVAPRRQSTTTTYAMHAVHYTRRYATPVGCHASATPTTSYGSRTLLPAGLHVACCTSACKPCQEHTERLHRRLLM